MMFSTIMVCPNGCKSARGHKLMQFQTKLTWLNHMTTCPRGALQDDEWEISFKPKKPLQVKQFNLF